MNVKHITTHSEKEAWSVANEIFPTDYEQDSRASQNAGYPIYWSTRPGCAAWISDLCTRLEVNLENGDTVVIWVEEEGEIAEAEIEEAVAEAVEQEMEEQEMEEQEMEEQEMEEERRQEAARMAEATKTAESMTLEALYTPEVCQRVTLCIDGNHGSEDEKRIYEAIKAGHPSILFDLLTRYAETHDIKWGGIWGTTAHHYDHGKTGRGHYIVTGYISGRIGDEIGFCANCADILRKAAEEHKERSGE